MRYRLDIDPAIRAYLAGVPLTREGRIRLHAAINDLATVSDGFRTDAANRHGPFFVFTHLFLDAGRVRQLRVVVDDASASYGILRFVYADLT